jgi:hypothetical protein
MASTLYSQINGSSPLKVLNGIRDIIKINQIYCFRVTKPTQTQKEDLKTSTFREEDKRQNNKKTHMSQANNFPNPNVNLHDRTIPRVPELMDQKRVPRD